MQTERLHARGPKGEAVIILKHTGPDGSSTFSLASGERLVPCEEAGVFATADGKRVFRLS